MASEQSCRVMANRIKTLLIHGVTADKNIKKYIASTFSDPDPEALREILQDETDNDRDSLTDLIFTPDETVQCRLEAQIETETFNPDDEERICRRIAMEKPESCLIFPEKRITIKLSLPTAIITAYVSRLKITQRLPLKLIAVINQQFDKAMARLIKVKLRNSGMQFTSEQVDFLYDFFKALSPSKKFLYYLNFMIPFLESLPANKTVEMALQAQREQYRNNIDLATRFEIMLKKSNMETLMLQGIRTPHISKAETIENIATIDDICYALWSQTDQIET